MQIDNLSIFLVPMTLRRPFTTSFGTQTERKVLLVKIEGEGKVGWGECVAEEGPWYSYETVESCKYLIKNYISKWIMGNKIVHPSDFPTMVQRIRGNPMAKACVEDAIWDLYGKIEGKSLASLIGGNKSFIPSGISLGIEEDFSILLSKIEEALNKRYKRIKIKIAPKKDVEVIKRIRDNYPEIKLMVDANAAYRLKDKEVLKQLDRYDLMMIEQPLQYYDILDHAKLQKELSTPICLDESIKSVDDARIAIENDATRIINVKPSRVGGISETLKIHALAKDKNIPLWVGGMLETGIGRAKNVAIASLPHFTLPNDISESERYFTDFIINPIFKLEDGTLKVPTNEGIGVDVLEDVIKNKNVLFE